MAAAELAVQVGVAPACRALGLARATFYRRRRPAPGHRQPRKMPARALDRTERERVLDVLASPRFVDRRTRRSRRHAARRRPISVFGTHHVPPPGRRTAGPGTAQSAQPPALRQARARRHRPNQVWSWDITRLLGPKRWTYFYLYVLLDIFSRYVVSWMLAERETRRVRRPPHRAKLPEAGHPAPGAHPALGPRLAHDREMHRATARRPRVTRSLSRPRVSDDNPFSEAQFKTLKYHPGFPGRFDDIHAATAFCRTFFPWYNHEHRHAGIAMLTPSDVHQGRAEGILEQRQRTLQDAWAQNPERFVHGPRNPSPCLTRSGSTLRRRKKLPGCSLNHEQRCLNILDRFRGAQTGRSRDDAGVGRDA